MADLTRTAANVRDAMPHKRDVINVRLAEAVERGHVGYQLTDGTFGIADADAAGKQQARGIFLQAGSAGDVVNLMREGDLAGWDLSGLNYDAAVYLSNTAGALADAAGTITALIGRVAGLTDAPTYTKYLHVFFNWTEVYA